MESLDIAELNSPVVRYSGSHNGLQDYIAKKAPRRPARVCILTQDIFGPVRNAGIGTAYMHAADFLAQSGHDVTILYTQGRVSHNKSIDHWIDFYKEKGVKFVCAPEPAVHAPTPALRWSYQGYLGLSQMPEFDFIHSSECGASPYYSLMAKRNLGQFSNSMFCIKTSSPHLWSRQGNEQPINLENGLVICAAERYCVEAADLIIAPSQHMLEWMGSHGYALPQHVCVQPNIMPQSAMNLSGDRQDGALRRINEIVFFGRLEPRKGLLVFAEALELLSVADGKKLKARKNKIKVTFLGKRVDDFDFDTFYKSMRDKLPFEFKSIHHYNATQAVEYLRGPGRLGVIPSLLDNSPFTVYEALANGIVFIAADVGGISELVHPDDRASLLFLPRPLPLSRTLQRILKSGGATGRLSFDPINSLEVWDEFHQHADRKRLTRTVRSEPPHAEHHRALEIEFRNEEAYPLNVEKLLQQARGSDAKYVLLSSNKVQISEQERGSLIEIVTNAGLDIAAPATTIAEKNPVLAVNFEPSRFTKLDFSNTFVPMLVIRRALLTQILDDLSAYRTVYQTNIDALVAVACRRGETVSVIPRAFGRFSGSVEKRLSGAQRSRQLEYLAAGLPPDVGNLFRMYGGVADERTRVRSAYQALSNLQRLLRVLVTLETASGEPTRGEGGGQRNVSSSKDRRERGWGARLASGARRVGKSVRKMGTVSFSAVRNWRRLLPREAAPRSGAS